VRSQGVSETMAEAKRFSGFGANSLNRSLTKWRASGSCQDVALWKPQVRMIGVVRTERRRWAQSMYHA
jgi:hypothetical protein